MTSPQSENRIGGAALWGVSLLLLTFSACQPGFLYTDITIPLMTNFNETPFSPVGTKGESRQLKEPITLVGARVEWASHGPGEIARENGLQTVAYGDIRYFGILGGLYRVTEVTVYGEGGEN